MKYTVIVSRYTSNNIVRESGKLALKDAQDTARAWAADAHEDNQVFITWFRSSDNQRGYYNDGEGHAITGKAWIA